MIMDNIQLIILIVTILGSGLAHGKIILGRVSALEQNMSARMSALESRMSALEGRMSTLEGRMSTLEGRMSQTESRMSHMEGLFEGFRVAGFSALSRSDQNQTKAA